MNKKIIIALLILLAIILATFLGVILFKDVYYESVLKDEVKQTEALYNIVQDIITEKGITNSNISLDDTFLKDLVTNEEFPDELKNKLTTLEKSDGEGTTYTFSCVYDEYTRTLMVTLDSDDETETLLNGRQTYTYYISVKSNKIHYETKYTNLSSDY